ncbi:hypothetical protein SVAN01_08390 [Stagonosporopsis vannaccii]|nr:hypothetical protein SVAN01_08390 [Stagonosporopsis vannaccii]
MRFPNISLLLIATLGVTQALVVPSSSLDSTALEQRDLTHLLTRAPPRAYKCPLKDPKKCTTCGKMQLTKGEKPKPVPCKKGTKGCKRNTVDDVEKRGATVPMDVTGGTAWAAEDTFGTTGLGSCSFVVIFDDAYVLGAHIPPARASGTGANMVLTATGKEVIDDHMSRIDGYLPRVRGTKNCLLVTATNLGQEELDHMRQKLAAKGLRCAEKRYDPTNAPRGGIFFLSRKNGVWPPQVVGPL